MGVILEAREVSRVYHAGANTVHALSGVNMELHEGRMIVIGGRSGSGKTTLLNILGGLDRPDGGKVLFRGQDLHALSEVELTDWRRHQVGLVFQSFALMPHLTAIENVEIPLRLAGVPWRERRERAEECLHLVGLYKRAKHRALELSGGEQQRTGIARAIANQPSLILADEPVGELDFETGLRVLELFRTIVDRNGITVCISTHDSAAGDYSDEKLCIEDGKLVPEIAIDRVPAKEAR